MLIDWSLKQTSAKLESADHSISTTIKVLPLT